MRWFWIDRFIEFERGRRAVSLKAVTMAEEQMDGYCPGFPHMPPSLIIEGMAQTAGLLIGEMEGFEQRVVLAKIGKAIFHAQAVPGDVLRYEATVADVKADGAFASVIGYAGDELLAEVDLMFAFLDDRFPSGPLFEPAGFAVLMRSFHVYDIGHTSDGQPIELPPFYAEAERAALGTYDPIPSPVQPSANGRMKH